MGASTPTLSYNSPPMTLHSFGHSVRLRDCTLQFCTLLPSGALLTTWFHPVRPPGVLTYQRYSGGFIRPISALHIFLQRYSHSAPYLKPHDTLLTPQPLLTTQSQLCQSSGIHFLNSLPYKSSCALITLRQTHHHHPYSTCNAEKNIHFSSVLLHFSHFSWLQVATKTKLNQRQRSLRSLAGPIPGYRAGQSRVEPRDEPTWAGFETSRDTLIKASSNMLTAQWSRQPPQWSQNCGTAGANQCPHNCWKRSFSHCRMNNEVKGLQFLVNQENCSLIDKVNIRILRESMKISSIWDRKSPRGKRLGPQSKFLTGGPDTNRA